MAFQQNSMEKSQKIFEKCGEPRTRSKRDTGSNSDIETDIVFEDQIVPEEAKTSAVITNQRDLVKSNMRRNDFQKLIKDIAKLGEESQGFWRHLPYVMCDQPVNRFQVSLFFLDFG